MQARDACVVRAGPLSDLLNDFVSRWERTRPPRQAGRFTGRAARTRSPYVSAVEWLVTETRGQVTRTTAEDLIGRRRATVELRVADALVAAIDAPHAWHDGTLEVIPNVRAAGRGSGCAHC